MANIPNDEERYKAKMTQLSQTIVDGSEFAKYLKKAVEKAFSEGYMFGQSELLSHAKRIVEVEEREKVDGLLLGNGTDEIPF